MEIVLLKYLLVFNRKLLTNFNSIRANNKVKEKIPMFNLGVFEILNEFPDVSLLTFLVQFI